MSYYTSLTGLNAATTELSVTSNNLANVNTTGFKQSRADFGDIVAASVFQSKGQPGLGTQLRGLDQQFTQGSFETTNETLNMAISGQGFFVTRNGATGGTQSLTRDGSFGTDKQGYVVDQAGNYLQGLPVDSNGNVTSSGAGALSSLRVSPNNGTATATTTMNEAITLPSTTDTPATRSAYQNGNYAFSPTDPDSYNYSTSTTIFDAAGNPQQATTYFVLTKAPTQADPTSTWSTHLLVGGAEATAAGGGDLQFNSTGKLTSPTAPVSYSQAGSGAPLAVDYGTNTKQAGSNFALTNVSQNGAGIGSLSGVTVDNGGVVTASYSDGSKLNVGRVAIASVINPAGLTQAGDNRWSTTTASGDPMVTGAAMNGMGVIRSGTLEVSNVDVTTELVHLIQAQRNFQANAKAIDTANQITETAVNLRS